MNSLIKQAEQKLNDIKNQEQVICSDVKTYCEGKLFKIVKNIYYKGYQNNLIGRHCTLKPTIFDNQLKFQPTVYNKRTGKIDIYHLYCYDSSYFEEWK